jgi:hypothetical protein
MQPNVRLANPLPCPSPESSDNWLLRYAWELAPPELRELSGKTKQLAAMPEHGFTPQMRVTVVDALVLEWAATSSSVAASCAAAGVLHQRITGTPGTKVDFERVRNRLAKINKSLAKAVCNPRMRYSPKSAERRPRREKALSAHSPGAPSSWAMA